MILSQKRVMILSHCFRLFLLLTQVECSLVIADSGKGKAANVSCIDNERQALLELKRSVKDDYGRLSSWDTNNNGDADCCNWIGVLCNNQTGHVEQLHLHGDDNLQQPLRGMISPSLMELRHLTVLDLSLNDFTGIPIPEFFGSLSNLEYLNLTHSSFGGKIPYQLGMLSNLWYLDLSWNDLEGLIPYQLGNLSKLEQLWLGYNLDLIIDNPRWLSNLSSLTHLDFTDVSNLNGSHNWLEMIKRPKLKSLLLRNCSLSDVDFISVPTSLLNFSTSLESLDLTYNKFTSLVFPWVFKLNTSLSYLFLANNFLEGPIPYNIGNVMRSLIQLKLSGNQLNGTIPESIGFLPVLKDLFLGMNSLKGVVTETFFANLTALKSLQLCENALNLSFSNTWVPPFQLVFLDLHSTKLGPRFPKWVLTQNKLFNLDISSSEISDTIPESLFCAHNATVPSLKKLNISNNQLSGQLPDCLNLLKSLVFFDLRNNKLSGKIPSSLSSLIQIRQLIFRNNNFTGELPSLENSTELTLLDMGENKISGPIPRWIGDKLQQLEMLLLQENHFYGSLPLTLCHLRNIQILDLSMNSLSGDIPKCIKNFAAMAQKVNVNASMNQFGVYDSSGHYQYYLDLDVYPLVMWKGKEVRFKNYQRILKTIDLSRNQLSGKVPPEIGNLVELVSLNISRNNFSGEIPSDIGNLRSLDFLDLSRNYFSGRIPSSISEISGLSVLDLSNNNFSGKIPTGTQLQSFDEYVYRGNPYLCGSPLQKLCPEDKTSEGPSIQKQREEDEDAFITQGFYISLSLGFVTGFWGIFGSLLLIRTWRHAYFHFSYNLMDKIYVMSTLTMKRWMQVARELIGCRRNTQVH